MTTDSFKYIKSGAASVLIDGQFGSTGKGLLAAYLAEQPQNHIDIATTNASANAGHWTKYADDREDFCCFHLPTFGIVQEDCQIYINAGAIINVDMLLKEMDEHNIGPERLTIHPNAAIITDQDIEDESNIDSSTTRISSTRKGVGSALARKVWRSAELAGQNDRLKEFIDVIDLNWAMNGGARVSVEVPQGYGLSVNGPFYPYCTSRNCTVSQGLADAGIHPSFLGEVAMSVRTFPIRVGSIPNLGYSGDVYPDQHETSFEDLGVEEELTTVTKRVRRIFTWSDLQFKEALSEIRPTLTFLNFCNYDPNYEDTIRRIRVLNEQMLPHRQHLLLGFGPNVEDVKWSK